MADITAQPVAGGEAGVGTRRRTRGSVRLRWAGIAGACAVVVWMVVLAVRGMVLRFSPVPWFDSWSGLVAFEQRIPETGLLSALWAPHNGHRIVLTRVLYLADRTLGGGDLKWLIIANGLLALSLAAALTWLCWRMLPCGVLRALFGLVSVVACTSWVNHENLIWEFQSQLILAPLLAVLTFAAAGVGADARDSRRQRAWFAAAVGLAVLALGSMGSGVLVPVLLLLVLACVRAPRRALVIAGAVMLPIVALYFVGLGTPVADGGDFPPTKTAFGILAFLGAPVGIVTKSSVAAAIVGAGMLVVAGLLSLRAARGKLTGAQVAGLAVVAFAIANAVVAARVRLFLGIEAMQASRYEFIVVSGWVALLALLVSVARTPRAANVRAGVGAACVLLLLVPFQPAALEVLGRKEAGQPRVSTPTVFMVDRHRALAYVPDRMVGALGIALGVPDIEQQVPALYYTATGWPELAEYARANGIGAFGGLLGGLSERIGSLETGDREVPCGGAVLDATPVPGDPSWLRVEGWTRRAEGAPGADLIAIRGPGGEVAGYAVTGYPSPENVAWPSWGDKPVGFAGYVRARGADSAAESLRVVCLVEE